jgi:hypothetical protein
MWTLDVQKQLTGSMALTVGYSGSKGTHLSSGLDRINQITMDTLNKYGRTLLNSGINSTGARAANIPIPYAGFGSSTAHTVQRALSPYPQYYIALPAGSASIGERAGIRRITLVMKLDRRFSSGLAAELLRLPNSSPFDSALMEERCARSLQQEAGPALSGVDQTHVCGLPSLDAGGTKLSVNPVVNNIIGDWTVPRS